MNLNQALIVKSPEILAIESEILKIADEKVANATRRFFKTGIGEYGEGDLFIGITIPQLRAIAKKHYRALDHKGLAHFLNSKIHENRLFALLAMVQKFESTANESEKASVVNFYLKNETLNRINNWDLVDISCYKILGAHLLKNPDYVDKLYELAASDDLWRKRIAIVSSFALIKANQFSHTKRIAELFLTEKHDLLQKATGWMLREMGKKSEADLREFLNLHEGQMPRVMRSYAKERLKL